MLVVYPSTVHVGAVTTALYLWSVAVQRLLPHTSHLLLSSTSLCPFAGIIVCATVVLPHTVHFLPSVRPVSVHVGASPVTVSSV